MNPSHFGIERECQITDVGCWKQELSKKFNCSKNDEECWVRLSNKLPCKVENIQCWKKQLPDMPCSPHDKECWKNLLPELPCKINDKECWNHLTQEHVMMDKKPILRSNPDWDEFEDNEDRNIGSIFRPTSYFNEIFGMI